MPDQMLVDNLDDQTVLLILSHLTQELQKDILAGAAVIQSEEEARQAIAALLNASGESVEAEEIIAGDEENEAVSRGVLKLLIEDEATRAKAEELVTRPPEEEQMSVELAIAGAVILGVLITWLQTKVELKVSRKDGKTSFEFKMRKDAADAETIKEVAQSVMTLLTGIR